MCILLRSDNNVKIIKLKSLGYTKQRDKSPESASSVSTVNNNFHNYDAEIYAQFDNTVFKLPYI